MNSTEKASIPVVSSKTTLKSTHNLIDRVLNNLNIGQKIGYGYGLALGVTFLGTVAGWTIGDYYQRQALEKHESSIRKVELVNRLKHAVLEARSHQQQFIPLVDKPKRFQEEYSHFLRHAAEIKQLSSETASYITRIKKPESRSNKILAGFLRKYKNTSEEYFQQIEALLQQIKPAYLKPEEVGNQQRLLLKFTDSNIALEFDSFSDDLTEAITAAYKEDKQSENTLILVEQIRWQIIAGSIVVSMLLVSVFAFYTTRAIASPISTLTNVAKQVTQEANFDLQAPVLSLDEVGNLGISLNLLIRQVKHLLEVQKSEAQAKLIESEKMSSLGRMVAGVAHEINNPINFISANLVHAKSYFEELLDLLQTYQTEVPHPPDAVADKIEEMDLVFLQQDLLKLINSMEFGAGRTKEIARSLKDFAYLDAGKSQLVEIHTCLDSTLLILNNRLKKGIEIIRDYGDIPAITGHTGLLYQVFMNLLSNAIDAVEEKSQTDSQFLPKITVTTECMDNNWVTVRIIDNGPGIAQENLEKIFEMFFTTKPRGLGTGLGLAISHQIVLEKHGGKITCHSQLGKGTEFAICIPCR
jgi:two-component system, NtrC family, sensor kinase